MSLGQRVTVAFVLLDITLPSIVDADTADPVRQSVNRNSGAVRAVVAFMKPASRLGALHHAGPTAVAPAEHDQHLIAIVAP
jgi:hypothetical protein